MIPARPKDLVEVDAAVPALAGPGSGPPRLIDIGALEAALLQLHLGPTRAHGSGGDRFGREVIANMVSAYAFLDWIVAQDIDIFAMGNLRAMLELNRRVLCGADEASRRENAEHLRETADRFYDQWGAGIRDVVEWHDRNRGASAYQRAAGVYVRMLSEPQLFLEGNHRTASLIAGYILMRAGEPPFVVTPAVADSYFALSDEIQGIHKRTIAMWIRMSGLKRRLAELLLKAADRRFLLGRS